MARSSASAVVPIPEYVHDLVTKAKRASGKLASLSTAVKNQALLAMADALDSVANELEGALAKGEDLSKAVAKLLTKMITGMGLARSDVYIGNIMNWRPQMPTVEGRDQVGNRPPTEEPRIEPWGQRAPWRQMQPLRP